MNVGLSVSRVGGSAQVKAMKKVAGTLRLDLAQYRELAAFAQFGSDLDKATMQRLERGKRMMELLKQPQYQPLPLQEQVAVLYAGTRGFLDDVPVEAIGKFEKEFLDFMRNSKADILNTIKETNDLDKGTEEKLKAAIEEFKKTFQA
jgi:F-type H+-transporting ATPase subunit alpha